MKVVAAFLLAVLSGKASPTSADIKDILGSGQNGVKFCNENVYSEFIELAIRSVMRMCSVVGAETEDAQIELLLKEVKGKDCAELIAVGREKLASVPCGGGGVAMASAPSAGGGGGAAPAEEAKKEEKKEEKEESDDDMGFSLFE
ncbi:hypothetical protein F2Q70_00008969 [Brassica cretica]|uniref:Uncharacterized protein n=1 Tax=Brassica cretica TaxID=69181 RepID=A0A8S9LUC0_BRACR|nr:hypothetical protein F2Q70_00008969 [Brassica cretica]KAF3545611.1 hypothetical protein DY000_02002698 [Brassica cretica]